MLALGTGERDVSLPMPRPQKLRPGLFEAELAARRPRHHRTRAAHSHAPPPPFLSRPSNPTQNTGARGPAAPARRGRHPRGAPPLRSAVVRVRATPPDAGGQQPAATTATTAKTTAATPAAAQAPPSASSVPLPAPPSSVPRSIHDVDNGRILGFGPDLGPDHPGHCDSAYKARRAAIARLALAHAPGTPVPEVAYTREEQETWRAVLARLGLGGGGGGGGGEGGLLPRHACREYLSAVGRLGFSPDRVPQLRDVDEALQRARGGANSGGGGGGGNGAPADGSNDAPWRLRPVAGLMHPRDFLAGLAFRTFHSTQYCRHPSQPQYTPEPDVVHELVGHVPMLLCPPYARMAEAVGRASLGCGDKALWHLIKVYWYSVEFGVVWERDEATGRRSLKAFGAGILSSSAELEWMGAGAAAHERAAAEADEQRAAAAAGGGAGAGAGAAVPPPPAAAMPPGAAYEVVPLDPRRPLPPMSYKDGVQRRYFSLESFEQGAALLEAYAREARGGGGEEAGGGGPISAR